MRTYRCYLLLLVGLLLGCAGQTPAPPMPKGATFAGRWSSNFQEMMLHQEGQKVWGTVAYRDGSLDGKTEGGRLRFRWYQRSNGQSGRGYLDMSPDGNHLEGRWGYGDDDSDGGRWWADR